VVRLVLIVGAVLLAAYAGAVQLASSAAYGDLAVRPSFPAALHDAAPRLLRPFAGDALARAAAALHDGDLAQAEALITTLPPDADSADLRGRIAEARGDRAGAIEAYIRAGDVVRAQALIDALAQSDPRRALAEQERLVAAHGNADAAEVRSQAEWRLGQLQAAEGYRDPAQRVRYWRLAEQSYERALALAPNEETYLLAAGYQSLANGDVGGSERWYERAAQVVPNSADAFAGLAWTAAARRDCATARADLARARGFRAAESGVRDPLDDPIAGAALKRCMR
jgi:tetratricopeptide (TPR) repeat protein